MAVPSQSTVLCAKYRPGEARASGIADISSVPAVTKNAFVGYDGALCVVQGRLLHRSLQCDNAVPRQSCMKTFQRVGLLPSRGDYYHTQQED